VKPVPATVMAVSADPARIEFGLIEAITGVVGGATGATTLRVAAVDVPPPGAAFTAVIARVPAADTSAAVRDALTCVELVKVVVRDAPFTSITVVGTNPVPVTVTTAETAPVDSLVGYIDVTVGAGLSTSNLIGVAVPLLDDPFKTTTDKSAPLANWAAGTVAVSWVALT
jgi:hypothetical protein